MPNLIDIKKMLDNMEEMDQKRLADAFMALVYDWPPIALPNDEEVSPVAESSVVAREMEVVWDDGGENEKSHTVDSRCCRNKDAVMVKKRKIVRREELGSIDAPTDGGVGVVAAEAVSQSIMIAKNRSGIGRGTGAQVFIRSRSLQATDGIEVVKKGKSVEQ